MKIAPNRTRRKSARLIAYAVFQNKYICHLFINVFILKKHICPIFRTKCVSAVPPILTMFIIVLLISLNARLNGIAYCCFS